MNSVMEGLVNGVPLVVVPQQVEQLTIGSLIAERGAAVVLRHGLSNRTVPHTELRAAVDRALTDPSPKDAAKAMAASLLLEGGASGAAEVIQHFVTP